jgi:3-oxoacyl-[acyl-carrier-protein] synthase-3
VIALATAGGPPIGISGIAAHLPTKVLSNESVASPLGLTPSWIEGRTGICERRIAEPGEAASDLAIPAARAALARAGADPSTVDLVVMATATPDTVAPATAAAVACAIGASGAAAYDVSAPSTGFLYALVQAYAAIAAGAATRAVVVCSEVLSRITNWRDRNTCVLFGDGAAAAVIEPVTSGGVVGFELGSDGSGAGDVVVPAGGSRLPASAGTIRQDLHAIQMNGAKVFRFSTRVTVESVGRVLDRCGVSVDDVDVYVPHQSNRRIIDHTARALAIPPERVLVNIAERGNTSSASIPLALAEAAAEGRLSAVGAGLTWGSVLLVWSGERAA